MKKILSLVVVLCLVLGCAAAMADVRVPERPRTQEELSRAFMNRLGQFFNTLDLNSEAVSIEAVANGNTVLNGGVQQSDDVIDLSLNVAGFPVEVQIGQEAIWVSVMGQVYSLRYENAEAIINTLVNAFGVSDLDVDVYGEIVNLFLTDVIMPAMTVEFIDGGTHIVVNLTGAALAKGLVRFGDDMVASDRYLNAVAMPISLIAMASDGQMVDVAGEIKTHWPQLRQELSTMQLPFLFTADIMQKEDSAVVKTVCQMTVDNASMTSSMSMNADANAVTGSGNMMVSSGMSVTYSFNMNPNTGAYTANMQTSNGITMDISSQPVTDGWHYEMNMGQNGQTLMHEDVLAVDSATAFDLTFTLEEGNGYGESEKMTLTAHFDKQSRSLVGQLIMPPSIGVSANLVGIPTAEGYRLMLTVSQDGEVELSADLNITNNSEVFAAELLAYPGAQLQDTKLTAYFAFAKWSGAYTFEYVGPDNSNSVKANGVIAEDEISLHYTSLFHEREVDKFDLELLDKYNEFKASVSYASAMRFGYMQKMFAANLRVDKYSGVFYGGLEVPSDYVDMEFEGVCNDDSFRFLLTSLYRNSMNGYLEFACSRSWDDSYIGEFTFTDRYDVTTGSFTWSETSKSLSLAGEDMQLLVSLLSDYWGNPSQLRIVSSDGYDGFELLWNSDGLTVKSGNQKLTAKAEFVDDSTFVIDLCSLYGGRTENHVYVTFSIEDDGVRIKGEQVSMRGDRIELFSMSVLRAAKSDVALLSDSSFVMEITPEMIEQLLNMAMQMASSYAGGYDSPSSSAMPAGAMAG